MKKNNTKSELKNQKLGKTLPKNGKITKKSKKSNNSVEKVKENIKKLNQNTTKTSKKLDILHSEKEKPNSSNSEGTEIELRKIAKKRAKRLAQKLKNKQKKQEAKHQNGTDEGEKSLTSKSETCKTDTTKGSNGAETIRKTEARVLNKKLKKAEKRKLIKENNARDVVDPESATIFVGNLPVNTKALQLERLFNDIGTIIRMRIRTAAGARLWKHHIRKNAGSLNAYIVFENKEIAERALTLNGVQFKENHLRITPADKNTLKEFTSQGVKRTVFVGNLKSSVNEEALRGIFSCCGEIDYIRCLRDDKNQCKGVAYVCFKSADAVGLALELNETMLEERPIHVERYSLKKQGAKEARDAANAENAVQQSKKNTKPIKNKINDGQRKKSDFKGVKVDPMKKKLNLKKNKKKLNNDMIQMAKKIAPKVKS